MRLGALPPALVLGVLLSLGAAASTSDIVRLRLAPGPNDLERSVARTTQLVAQAESLGLATARLQNAWSQLASEPGRGCGDGRAAELAQGAELLGVAWRQRLQASRAELGRARRIAAAETVRPLLGAADEAAVEAVAARVDRASVAYLVAVELQQSQLQPFATRCPVPLAPRPGLAASTPQAREELDLGVAVLVQGGGTLCPDPAGTDAPVAVPGPIEAVVLGTPRACWSAGDCTCEPMDLLPGAVLGPTPEARP